MMKRPIIFDFDHTLFNATRFKKALANSLFDFGISEKVWQETYNESKTRDDKKQEYLPEHHLKILSEKFEVDFHKLTNSYNKVINQTNKFLYPDSLLFLKKLKVHPVVKQKVSTTGAKSYKLILLTFGDPTWQKRKLKAAKIAKYFEKMVFTNKNKFEVLDQIPDVKNAVFINDNPQEIQDLQKLLPQTKFIQIKRSDGKKYSLRLKNIAIIEKLIEVKL